MTNIKIVQVERFGVIPASRRRESHAFGFPTTPEKLGPALSFPREAFGNDKKTLNLFHILCHLRFDIGHLE
ncbi:MAG: hypothetical protein A3G33_04725 [Omnitrophica bacterium RIFCSPLOWO2_12_FULL_44_17]|uniref:Uncharacterized protein n=1 Tax=Candidatus Danuiimicrobium aquiferis TaxID=1801832 RepID=A0A1G1KQR3_9BACT|nr:MAG: hypothetical protein A3B72_10935 [Omnitrophica bacterium RIFCSPHIGHO2_02_FULL_45_28]OGW89390.1 MAG: hypothetical protein A3E74_02560 [Omnitrophica bacterium RIFCSPHIGHO2_12_FULL_44_12]OGW95238.1 MAG: hypothetical protein A3G33_04725 [Omnitrophica bacterium RIFCSPLOWO2_12_FULL_44_17]OGX02334.1 MAG: hypothetical protein A3J12_10050 [Omnitrophica bacterium RIFCSPLOWO2_02_FULL_44_11]